MALNVISFNCNSIRKNIEIVKELLKSCDILLLQETIITEYEIDSISNIDLNFKFCHAPSTVPNILGKGGRPKGGLSVFWHKKIDKIITPVVFTTNIMALKLEISDSIYYLFNVYMPCDDRKADSLAEFKSIIAQLEVIIDDEDVRKMVVAGDWNADPNKGRFWKEFIEFTTRSNLTVSDLILPPDTFSYLSVQHGSTSYLDHVCTSDTNLVDSVSFLQNVTLFDHLPMYFKFNVPSEYNIIDVNDDVNINVNEFILWDKMTEREKLSYTSSVELILSSYSADWINCNKKMCSSQSHKNQLTDAYKFCLKTLKFCSEEFTVLNKNSKFKTIPGWSTNCKNLYTDAKKYLFIWNSNGRMRTGNDYENMKQFKNKFKYEFAKCKKNEKLIKKNKLAESFVNKSKVKFWKDIKQLKKTNKTVINCIDDKRNIDDIIELFNDKFKKIFKDKVCQKIPDDFQFNMVKMRNSCLNSTYEISSSNIEDSISNLNDCLDIDGLHANHFKFANKPLTRFLRKLFNSFLSHGHMPVDMLKGKIMPLIKDKLKSNEDSNNYRAITISSTFLKIFEYSIIEHMEYKLKIIHKQLGFVKNTSTAMAISILQEVIKSYTSKGSDVYTAFLDLSKAFDKVNPYILLNKLCVTDVNPCIVNMLNVMYFNQHVHVSFNNKTGQNWKLGNGVRQGGILSPLLFNFYINDVLETVTKCNVGCMFNDTRHNTQYYADDNVLLSPSKEGLQLLIDITLKSLTEIGLSLNAAKSICVIFKNTKTGLGKNNVVPVFKIKNEIVPIVNNCKYLGVILSNDFCQKLDIQRAESSFLKQFYTIFRKFYFADSDALTFLFSSHCTSLYCAELWHNIKGSQSQFKSFSVTYHKAIKKIHKKPWAYSNHDICEEAGLKTFKHLINQKMATFAFNLMNNNSMCFNRYKSFFISDSFLFRNIRKIFQTQYQIEDVFQNDFQAVKARISYVQRNETRSTYFINRVIQ
jgi:hypothetical protein